MGYGFPRVGRTVNANRPSQRVTKREHLFFEPHPPDGFPKEVTVGMFIAVRTSGKFQK